MDRTPLPLSETPRSFLGIYAPLVVVIVLFVWGMALIFGYGLLFLALQSELQPRLNDLGAALYFAGTSLLTLGFGDIVATGGITRILHSAPVHRASPSRAALLACSFPSTAHSGTVRYW
jgi:hypothetical protein